MTTPLASVPHHPAVALRPRRKYHVVLAFVLLVLSLPAMVAGLVVAVSMGYTLGPVLTGRQRSGLLAGAFMASLPSLGGVWFALRARAEEQRGGTVALVLDSLVAGAIWLMAVVAMFV